LKKNALFVMGLFLFLILASPCSAEEIKHTVVKGDTLWDISMKYLQTPWKWPLVWADNQDITNPHLIYPGDLVVITRDGDRTIIKIIPSSARGGAETTYTVQEAAAVKDKSIVLSPQYSTYIYSPNTLSGSGAIVRKIGVGELIAQDDFIVINATTALKVNQAITIMSKLQDVTSGSDQPAGYLYKAVATAIVDEVQGNTAKARLNYSLQEARVGDVIFDDLAPVKPLTLKISEPTLNAPSKVIDYYGGIEGSATNDLIFINAGKTSGIDKGAVLRLTRPITYEGEDKKEQTVVFNESIGMILVMQSLDNSSMGLMLDARVHVKRGDRVLGKK